MPTLGVQLDARGVNEEVGAVEATGEGGEAPRHTRLRPRTGALRRRRSRGVALVEFAIIFPVLAVLLLGMVDLGRAYSLQSRLRNAAREGAVYVRNNPTKQVPGATCADPNNGEHHALTELTEAADSEDDGFVVTFDPATTCGVASTDLEPGDTITVTVTAPFELITPIISNLVGSPIDVSEDVDVVIQ